MFWIAIVLLVVCLWAFFERLTFPSGRLGRRSSHSDAHPLTRMGPDQFIELSFGTVHYVYHSSSSSLPLNIFVHGYSTPMQMWQDVFQALVADGQPCLVFDLYGRGWSDSPSIPMNVDIFVSQLAELLYALSLPHDSYHLYGVSMGGAIIQRFTELHPQKVSKLILCCSAGLTLEKPGRLVFWILALPLLGPMAFKFIMQRGDERKARLQWAFPDREYFQVYRKLFQTGCREHPGYLRALFSTVTTFDFESASTSIEAVAKLNIPVLIVWGDKDTLIPVSNAYQFHRLYPTSTLCIIPGATHMLLIEHSPPVIDAVRTFLKEHLFNHRWTSVDQ